MKVINMSSRAGYCSVRRPTVGRAQVLPSRRRAAIARAQAADAQVELPELLEVDGDFPARHTFSGYANWLVPGYVMVGQYPYMHGKECKSHGEGEARLEQILQAGVTVFVSTLTELPPQSKMPIGGRDGFLPYKPAADLIAAGFSGPPPGEIVDGLRNPYLDKFIPPRRREASEAYRAYKPIQPTYLDCRLDTDMSQNSADDVAAVVETLDDTLKSGGKLYIHSTTGTGRAGVLAACLLVRTWGVSPEEAMSRLQMARNLRGDAPEGTVIDAPASPAQVEFVKDVCKRFA